MKVNMPSPFSVDKKYTDGNGSQYTYIGAHPHRGNFPFIFVKYPYAVVYYFDSTGTQEYGGTIHISEVKPKITRWINIYQGFVGYETKGKADGAAGSRRVACIKVEFEEGEGLQDV